MINGPHTHLCGYTHQGINHNEYFADPIIRKSTHRILSTWGATRRTGAKNLVSDKKSTNKTWLVAGSFINTNPTLLITCFSPRRQSCTLLPRARNGEELSQFPSTASGRISCKWFRRPAACPIWHYRIRWDFIKSAGNPCLFSRLYPARIYEVKILQTSMCGGKPHKYYGCMLLQRIRPDSIVSEHMGWRFCRAVGGGRATLQWYRPVPCVLI